MATRTSREVFHWKTKQLYKAVTVEAGLFKTLKLFYTKQK